MVALKAGRYLWQGNVVDISAEQGYSEAHSALITPEAGKEILAKCRPLETKEGAYLTAVPEATVKVILDLAKKPGEIGVLNFASGKNPGG